MTIDELSRYSALEATLIFACAKRDSEERAWDGTTTPRRVKVSQLSADHSVAPARCSASAMAFSLPRFAHDSAVAPF